MKGKRIWTVVCILILGMLISGCKSENGQIQNETDNAGQSQTEQKDGNSEDIVIRTAFGDLFYPDQWSEFVQTEQTNSGDTIIVSFNAYVHNTTYALFEVTIGGDDGILVGELTDAAGTKRNVYMRMEEIPEDPQLTEGEQNRLYAMQEDLNYLIDSLK